MGERASLVARESPCELDTSSLAVAGDVRARNSSPGTQITVTSPVMADASVSRNSRDMRTDNNAPTATYVAEEGCPGSGGPNTSPLCVLDQRIEMRADVVEGNLREEERRRVYLESCGARERKDDRESSMILTIPSLR